MDARLRLPLAALSALCAAALAVPAVADAGSDADRIEGCLDAAGGDAARLWAACEGTVSKPCLAASPDTTLAIGDCLMRENAAWDALLNRFWAPLRDRARADGSGESLLAAQRAWIDYRDKDCAQVYDSFGGGSLRTIAAADCFRSRTGLRAAEFHRRLRDGF